MFGRIRKPLHVIILMGLMGNLTDTRADCDCECSPMVKADAYSDYDTYHKCTLAPCRSRCRIQPPWRVVGNALRALAGV